MLEEEYPESMISIYRNMDIIVWYDVKKPSWSHVSTVIIGVLELVKHPSRGAELKTWIICKDFLKTCNDVAYI